MKISEATTILTEHPHALIRIAGTTGRYLTDTIRRYNESSHVKWIEVIPSDDEAGTARILTKRLLREPEGTPFNPDKIDLLVQSDAQDLNAGAYRSGDFIESIVFDGTEYVATLVPF